MFVYFSTQYIQGIKINEKNDKLELDEKKQYVCYIIFDNKMIDLLL